MTGLVLMNSIMEQASNKPLQIVGQWPVDGIAIASIVAALMDMLDMLYTKTAHGT
jgi:hypothetical protein